MADDVFERMGHTWHRAWLGDNGGNYLWASDDGRLTAWREGHKYRFAVDGVVHADRQISLRSAMDRAALSIIRESTA